MFDYYFNHKSATRDNSRIHKLIFREGMAGYGIFWSLLERLCNCENQMEADFDVMAFEFRTEADLIRNVVDNYGLFIHENGIISSKLVKNRPIKQNSALFTEIKGNFAKFKEEYQGNKTYLLIAYSFWSVWIKSYPTHRTFQTAKVDVWVDDVKKIIETDKQPIERLVVIIKYFEKCAKGDTSYRDFWFRTIKSCGGLRNNKNGIFNIDRIIDEVNEKIQTDDEFAKIAFKAVENFKKLTKFAQ